MGLFDVFKRDAGDRRDAGWSEARQEIAPGHAVALWKPGCFYCTALQAEMAGDDRVTWVNVRSDGEANSQVRGLNDGEEYTPTVIVGRQVLRNPSAAELRAALDGRVSDEF